MQLFPYFDYGSSEILTNILFYYDWYGADFFDLFDFFQLDFKHITNIHPIKIEDILDCSRLSLVVYH